MPPSKGRVPLYRALSKLGKASREEAKRFITEGKVKVHGSVVTNPHYPVNPDQAFIEIMGSKLVKEEPKLYVFHKPVGSLTTKRDPEGRKTIYDDLPPEMHQLHPVGRLDQNTSGLLFLTNSTRLSHFLTDPKNAIPRKYIVEVRGLVTSDEIAQMKKGITDRGEKLQFQEALILKSSNKESRLEVTLLEGKNREIRRVCDHFDHEVIKLKRIEFAGIELGTLRPGEIREVLVQTLLQIMNQQRR